MSSSLNIPTHVELFSPSPKQICYKCTHSTTVTEFTTICDKNSKNAKGRKKQNKTNHFERKLQIAALRTKHTIPTDTGKIFHRKQISQAIFEYVQNPL